MPEVGDKARLQGWAVLENMTGTAWRDVALTLTSGSPVTFRQALYDPYYVPRQTVAPPVSRLAMPRTDQGQIAADSLQGGPEMRQGAAEGGEGTINAKKAVQRFAAAPAPQSELAENEPAASEAVPGPVPTLGARARSAEGAENLSGASFSLTAPVSVKPGESVTLPFIDTPVTAEDCLDPVRLEARRNESPQTHPGCRATSNPLKAIRVLNFGRRWSDRLSMATMPPGLCDDHSNRAIDRRGSAIARQAAPPPCTLQSECSHRPPQ